MNTPSGLSCLPGNEKLVCSWQEVPGATGYKLYYDVTPATYSQSIDTGTVTSYTIAGLTNDQNYYISVSAYFQPMYFFNVAAVDGEGNISSLVNEISFQSGSTTESGQSEEITNYPEETQPYPKLADENKCFIATAAHGSLYKPEVTVLRRFRDQVLMHFSLGRFLVQAYYHVSPPVAQVIARNDFLRYLTRAALWLGILLVFYFSGLIFIVSLNQSVLFFMHQNVPLALTGMALFLPLFLWVMQSFYLNNKEDKKTSPSN